MVVINGAKGFIGSNILWEFTEIDKIPIRAINGDMNSLLYKQELKGLSPDIFIHAAGKSNPDDPDSISMVRSNIEGLISTLDCLPKGCKFIFLSTTNIYADRKSGNLYTMTKAFGEDIVEAYGRRNKIRPHIIRLGPMVGNNMSHGLVYELSKAIKNKEKIIVYGKYPGAFKAYTHTRDLNRIIRAIITGDFSPNIINCYNNDRITTEKVIEVLAKNYNVDKDSLNIEYLESKAPKHDPIVDILKTNYDFEKETWSSVQGLIYSFIKE